MRHAACQLTDRLHFLTLNKLRLQRFKFGCIGKHSGQTGPPVGHVFMQRHLHKGFTLRSRQTQKLGLLQTSAQGGIAQPIRQSPPQPLHHLFNRRRFTGPQPQ